MLNAAPERESLVPTSTVLGTGARSTRLADSGRTVTLARPNTGLDPDREAAAVTSTVPRYPAVNNPVESIRPWPLPSNHSTRAPGTGLPSGSSTRALN